MQKRRAAAVVLGWLIAGCASLSGLSGGGDAGTEAGAPEDGARDAGSEGAAGGPDGFTRDASRWCASQTVTFCADFDEYADIGSLVSAWTTSGAMGGLFALDTRAGVPSRPNALQVQTTAGSGRTFVLQTLAIPATVSKARLEFDLRIDSLPSIGVLSGIALAAISPGTSLNDGVAAFAFAAGPQLVAAYAEPTDAGGAVGDKPA